MTQLSFFGATASEPAVDDLAGLLAGPGQAVVRGGTARVSVVVGDAWRVAALTAGLDALGLAAEVAATPSGATAVRSPFTPVLLPLVRAWHQGGGKRAPGGLVLGGGALRWWCLAAGRGDPPGHVLALGGNDEPVWGPVGGALAAAGVPATFVGPRGGGPAYRVTGARRLARLRELVGEPPQGAGPDWPG